MCGLPTDQSFLFLFAVHIDSRTFFQTTFFLLERKTSDQSGDPLDLEIADGGQCHEGRTWRATGTLAAAVVVFVGSLMLLTMF